MSVWSYTHQQNRFNKNMHFNSNNRLEIVKKNNATSLTIDNNNFCSMWERIWSHASRSAFLLRRHQNDEKRFSLDSTIKRSMNRNTELIHGFPLLHSLPQQTCSIFSLFSFLFRLTQNAFSFSPSRTLPFLTTTFFLLLLLHPKLNSFAPSVALRLN